MAKAKISTYHAVFEPALEGGFNVSFPSFPGCVTFGRTLDEAKRMAREVLELWIEELTAQGESIPGNDKQPIVSEVEARIPVTAV